MSKAPKTLTPEECSRLLNYLRNHRPLKLTSQQRLRNFCIAVLMLDAGVRVGELVLLKVWDLYFGNHPMTNLVLRTEITKTKVERLIPCSMRLQETIDSLHSQYYPWRNTTSHTYAFTRPNSYLHMCIRSVQLMISKAGEDCLGRKVTPHMLRHTFATRVMRTANIRVVQRLLGHKSITSTQIYTHPNHEDLTKAIKNIE